MNHATDLATDLYPTELRHRYRMGFTVGEHSAGHMRRILRIFLTRWELDHLTDAAELALTELVANVVRHVPGRSCTVLILREPHALRVEVADEVPGPLYAKAAEPLAEGGRGLALVEAVTDRWGVEPSAGGKTVWFECDNPPTETHRPEPTSRNRSRPEPTPPDQQEVRLPYPHIAQA
ncbi:ATP-binding protein [Streptomyces sp. Je 1-79]|uniref:ATP-binding protein n=1 Tax=Streptomyces sp. Je 1-79 TaxID=2943847 RepID=UPI0027E4F7B0|nr:ATP-binding protein [Streptomyces sp. Je 1-79]